LRRYLALLAVLAVTLTAFAALPPAGLAPATAQSCSSQRYSIHIELSRSRYPHTTDHISDAIRAGEAALLHIDRAGADQNRRESLAGVPTKSGYDRDEYPPAVSREGGYGASVRYVPSSDNRGAGSVMGAQLSGWCDGQPFRMRVVP
jgi:hypothetical protein